MLWANMVTNILLGATLLVLVLFGLSAFRVLRRFQSQIADAREQILGFVLSPGEGKQSPLGDFLDATSMMFARALVAQAKTTFMGLASGASRGAAAVEGDIAVDMASNQSPMIAGLIQSSPMLQKTLRRNPMLAMIASAALQKLMGAQSGAPSVPSVPTGSNGHSDQFRMGL